jgi:MerR family transcriptional regulator, thiopeptide resistance regulator
VSEDRGTGRRWSIGELARMSGVTVRALHHYDAIGLVRASERTAAGHRRYTESDLRRLYQVRALRALGTPLDRIGDVPADDPAAMRALLQAQLDELTAQAERVERLTGRLRSLLRRLDDGSLPDPMTTLEMIAMLDGYFTPEQQEQLARRRAELGPAADGARTRWAALVEELLPHVQADTPADDPRVRDLVRRWDELGSAFHTDQATVTAARRMWQDHSAELGRGLPWPAERMADLVTYLERVRRAG